jgi:hypothetical protein
MFKNWKTTVSGLVGAIAVAVIPVLQSGKINYEAIAIAVAIAVLSFFAKDHDVTGNPPKTIE